MAKISARRKSVLDNPEEVLNLAQRWLDSLKREPPHPLDHRQIAIDPLDRRADRLAEHRVVHQSGQRRRSRRSLCPGPGFGEGGIGHDQRDQMRPPVAEHHRLRDLRLQGQEPFDALRRDVVAARVDDDGRSRVGSAS